MEQNTRLERRRQDCSREYVDLQIVTIRIFVNYYLNSFQVEKQKGSVESSSASCGNLAGNGRGEGRWKNSSEGHTKDTINHRVKKGTKVTQVKAI